ncbi:MAG: A/G-specific adenine glycosylase [Prevotellaceae bacterium]|jgi:A/G-specific adenine glycosylase|nr:A/G-specific adenine glycosylase [Prevotellaceae bacterium]
MSDFSMLIIAWYEQNGRDLPWRNINDSYKIWVSEVILQQTRVDQGRDYYLRFISRFPTVGALADAEEEEVLKHWQGLGYYSRARNLHYASKQVMTDFKGVFPTDYDDVMKLKGIGAYTAAAIVSFAHNRPYAVVDGNVYRVLSRYFAIDAPIDSAKGKKMFFELAQELLDKKQAGIYNQAIMDFGALQCVPSNPDCNGCVLKDSCLSFGNDEVRKYPVKSKKTKVSNRYFNYLYIVNGEFTYLQKRTKNDIWKNLYEFPLIESSRLYETEDLSRLALFSETVGVDVLKISAPVKHVLSHQCIFTKFYTVAISDESVLFKDFIKIPILDLDKYPVSRLMEMYLEKTTR